MLWWWNTETDVIVSALSDIRTGICPFSPGGNTERERFLSIPPGKLDVQKWPGKHLYPIICKSIYLVNSQPALQCWDERERWIRDIPWVYIIYNQGLQVKAMLCQHLRYCQLPIVFCVKLHLFSSSFPWIEFELLTPEFWEIVTIKMSFVSNPFAKKQVWVVWVFNVLYIEPIIIMWCYDEMQKLTSKDEFNPLIVIEKSF